MPGYVTQSRPNWVTGKSTQWSYHDSSVSKTGDVAAWANPTQTTTSFRSGRSEFLVPDDTLDFNPTSYGDAFAYYKKSYDEDRNTVQGDTGHTFSSTKQVYEIDSPIYNLAVGGTWFKGPLTPRHTAGTQWWPSTPDVSLGFYQTRAIERTAPTNSAANLAQFLAELKFDNPPHKVGSSIFERASFFKKLGEEYLNIEFGWKPFVSDVKDILNSVIHYHKVMSQYERDAGRIVRRKCSFEPVVVSSAVTKTTAGIVVDDPTSRSGFVGNPYPGSALLASSGGQLTDHTVTTTKTWFRGAYTYFLPVGHSYWDEFKRFERKANHLLGLDFTPDLLWELTPWSWLVDWNVNIGDNLKVASLLSTDGLVIRYGYLMQQSTAVRTRTVSGQRANVNGVPTTLPPFSEKFTVIRKQRLKASPYGFGSNPASYTGRQWSILAALGLTKAPNSLH